MESEILKLASTQGVWAALTIFLIFYILKVQEKRDLKQEEREDNYQKLVNQLTEKLSILENIQLDINDIKKEIIK